MPYEIHVLYTEALLRQAARRFLWRYMGRDALLAPAGTVLAVILWLSGIQEWYVLALGGGGLILGSMVLLMGVLYAGRTVRRIRGMRDPVVVWRFTETGLSAESELGRSEVPWSAVSKVWCFPEVWLLFFGPGGYSTLPTEQLEPELQAFIANRVREAGGTVS